MVSGTRSGAITAGLLIAGCTIAWLSACGLSRSGLSSQLDDSDGSTGMDASHRPADAAGGGDGQGEGSIGTPCNGVDAACLGVLPPGWEPVGVGDGGCAQGYTTQNLVTNPRLADGGCACGACQVIGSYGCDASVAISGGDNNCGDPPFVTVTPGICSPAQAQHVEAHVSTATGSVGCFAANDAGAGAVTDPLTLCLPECATDYCQAGQRCIAAFGELPCPTGYSLLAHAGAGVDTSCPPCACDAGPPGTCAGSVSVYSDTACSDAGLLAIYTAGGCNEYSSDYNSVLVQVAAPQPSCTAAPAAEGDASLTGVKTICCK